MQCTPKIELTLEKKYIDAVEAYAKNNFSSVSSTIELQIIRERERLIWQFNGILFAKKKKAFSTPSCYCLCIL